MLLRVQKKLLSHKTGFHPVVHHFAGYDVEFTIDIPANEFVFYFQTL